MGTLFLSRCVKNYTAITQLSRFLDYFSYQPIFNFTGLLVVMNIDRMMYVLSYLCLSIFVIGTFT